jgi:hypothetical protein
MVTEHSLRPIEPRLPLAEVSGRHPSLTPRQIPWGYNRDRVTAIAVDPIQLFVYWELRDETLEQGRRQLGPAGADAALVVRVFDTSGRIFDGTNAHSSFDQDVHRNDRQWFCIVGKPSSSAHVELGLRARDGRFTRLGRSGRVDFPRNSPTPTHQMEWMRVVPQSGDIASRETPDLPPPAPGVPTAGAPGGGAAAGEVVAVGGPEVLLHERYELVETTPLFERALAESWEIYEQDVQRFESDSGWQVDPNDPSASYRMISLRWEEFGISTSRWETGPVETSWQAGPFSYPTTVIAPAVERHEGPRMIYRSGAQVRVLHGPWQVVIRGINAHSERRVLARWEVHRSWVSVASSVASSAATGAAPGTALPPGGASERMLSASELRLKGASEIFYLGASERRLGGASESRFLGASQALMRGASERRLAGASELRLGGASERRLGGASERHFAGASEIRLAGASERRLGGASERRAGGSEPRLSAVPSIFPHGDKY